MDLKLLLDENISPKVGEQLLVTKNIDHFEKLATAREIHAGIVLLEDAAMNRGEQLRVIRLVVRHLKEEPDLVNRVLRVATDGAMPFEEVPPR